MLESSGGGRIAQGTGVATQALTYDAYGNALDAGFGVMTSSEGLTNLQYSGEWTNTNTGKQYLRARWYDPSKGTFNRLDPYAGDPRNPVSLNKYQYTHADPISGIDPTGLSVSQGTGNSPGFIGGSGSSVFAERPSHGTVPLIDLNVLEREELLNGNALAQAMAHEHGALPNALPPASTVAVSPPMWVDSRIDFRGDDPEALLWNADSLRVQQAEIYRQIAVAAQYADAGDWQLFDDQVRMIHQAGDNYNDGLINAQRQAVRAQRAAGFFEWFDDAGTAYVGGRGSSTLQALASVNRLNHLGLGLDGTAEQQRASHASTTELRIAADDYAATTQLVADTAFYAEKATFWGSIALGGVTTVIQQTTKKAALYAGARYAAAQAAGYAVDRYVVNPAIDTLIEEMELNPHAVQFTLLAVQMYRLGRGGAKSVDTDNGTIRTNAQLVEDIGTRAQQWVRRSKQRTALHGMSGRAVGTKQHKYSKDVLERYQRIYGDRGLRTERSFLNGVEVPYGTKGSTRLDVWDINTSNVWDYKFGRTPMSAAQYTNIYTHGPNVTSVTEVSRP